MFGDRAGFVKTSCPQPLIQSDFAARLEQIRRGLGHSRCLRFLGGLASSVNEAVRKAG